MPIKFESEAQKKDIDEMIIHDDLISDGIPMSEETYNKLRKWFNNTNQEAGVLTEKQFRKWLRDVGRLDETNK